MDLPDRIWLDRFYTEEITGGHFRCTRYRMNTGAGGDIEYVQASAVKAAANAPADPALLALAKLGAMVYAGLCVPEFSGDESAADGRDVMDVLQEFRQLSGVDPFLPGIASAIAALLAPDGAASDGVARGD